MIEMEPEPEPEPEELTYTQAEGRNELVNHYNGNNIYRFEKDGCEIYYRGNPGAKFAIVNGTSIISLPNNETILPKKLEEINKYIRLSIILVGDLKPEVIIIIEPTDCFKIDKDYLSNAQAVVAELNKKLEPVGLHMVVDYKMHMTGEIAEMDISALTDLLLCLYIKDTDKCISSVEMVEDYNLGASLEDEEVKEGTKASKNIIVNSMTHYTHEGKKYNKLNRAAVIMIAGRTGHKSVISEAVHPSSAWLFWNSFKGKIHNEPDFTPPDGIPSYAYLEKYLDDMGASLVVEVAVNKGSVKQAADVFAEVLSSFKIGGRFPLRPPFLKRPTKRMKSNVSRKRPAKKSRKRPTKMEKNPINFIFQKRPAKKSRQKKAD